VIVFEISNEVKIKMNCEVLCWWKR